MIDSKIDAAAAELRSEFVRLLTKVSMTELHKIHPPFVIEELNAKTRNFARMVGLLDELHYDYVTASTGLVEELDQIAFPPNSPLDTIHGLRYFISLGVDGKWRAIAASSNNDAEFVASHLELVQGFDKFSDLYVRVSLMANADD